MNLLFSSSQLFSIGSNEEKRKGVWSPDNRNSTYSNPIIFADYADPDVIRVNDDFYMVSSSFNCTPVIPILHSKDLVNWTIVGHVSENLPSTSFDTPQQGKGCWAPSIRYHNGEFYVYYGDPDFGIYMSKTKNPAGPWEPLFLVKQTKGWIDPCPLWDDDGNAYLVHAWAKSRVGFNSILNVNRMSVNGKNIFIDSATVFDGHKSHPTIEGPKFYKRNGYYYIFAPAGGVPTGWQTVLRSKNVFGPYEDKIVLAQGTTTINGPHQGGWIETQTGESWFVHFQDRGPYGRIIHLQPVKWNNDWPVIGLDTKGTGRGEPVLSWKKPNVRKTYPIAVPQTNDEFDSAGLGLQWQWHANHSNQWYSLKDQKGILRLHSLPVPKSYKNLMDVPNLLLQKFPAPAFTVTTQVSFNPASDGEKTGLLIMGNDYAYIAVVKRADGLYIIKCVCTSTDKGNAETEEAKISLMGNSLLLRVAVDTEAICRFYYSNDSKTFKLLGLDFVARKGLWIGAKVGLFAIASNGSTSSGFADYDWFRIE